MKRYKSIAVILGISLMLSACAGSQSASQSATDSRSTGYSSDASESNNVNSSNVVNLSASTKSIINTTDIFSKRDLSGEYDSSESVKIELADNASKAASSDVDINGNTITIKKEGTYIISGTLTNGSIIVDADKSDKIQLVLGGVKINSESSAAIYVKQADKVFITLADNSVNTLSNGGEFIAIDENNIDAVIFSKDDLTLNGSGTLKIESPAGHGVVSKDDLIVTDGIYEINAASHGLSANDCIGIANGSFDITAGKDALHSENDKDENLGYVYIEDGRFTLSVESDGISALSELNISGGDITITKSYEGLEARVINISGGNIDITSSDDGINATDKSSSEQTGSDMMRPDMTQLEDMPQMENFGGGKGFEMPDNFEGGRPEEMPENFDGSKSNRMQGEVPENIPERDNSQSNFEQRGGGRGGMRDKGGFGGMGGDMDTQERANINISGGIIKINAEGDGVDSNGYLTVSGGEIFILGPSDNGNAAIDYGISAAISGGVVVAAGQSGMAQNFGTDSTQCSMLVNVGQQQAGGELKLLDSNGNELLAYTINKSYNCVVISCPQITQGSSYTVKAGSDTTEITMDSIIYGDGFGGFNMHGGMR